MLLTDSRFNKYNSKMEDTLHVVAYTYNIHIHTTYIYYHKYKHYSDIGLNEATQSVLTCFLLQICYLDVIVGRFQRRKSCEYPMF